MDNEVCIFASPNLAAKDKYLNVILRCIAQNSLLIETIPDGCFIVLVSGVDRSYWDGSILEVEMKFSQLPLPASSIFLFPSYTIGNFKLDGCFADSKYDESSWFLSAQMETFFFKIRDNVHVLAFKLLETSKYIPISQTPSSTYFIFNEIFKFTFDFVCEMPEFVRQVSLKGGIIDGLADVCSNWIFFTLKGIESNRGSLRKLIDILEKMTDKIAIFFDSDALNDEQFEKFRCSIVAGLKELVARQMWTELEPFDKIRHGDLSAEVFKHRECFQLDRESKLMQHINALEFKLDLKYSSGTVLIDAGENVSLKKKLSDISSNLPSANFKWRKVL